MSECVNSGMHINEGDTLIEVPDDWDGGIPWPEFRATCPMCLLEVMLTEMCAHGPTVGFHWPKHEVPA